MTNISILELQLLCENRYYVDWVPTLNLGHGKSATQREQNAAREARAERSKERRKRQVELQEQEHLLKQQKLNEPVIPLADFASEIENSSTVNSRLADTSLLRTAAKSPSKVTDV